MLFNSLDFAIFLPIVFIVYWFVFRQPLRLQNLFLVVASAVFYGWWDWRYLIMLAISSINDFNMALLIDRASNLSKKKLFLIISLGVNLGMLFFFKYFNFFIESFSHAFNLFGQPFPFETLRIILPVGISFYTFQALSYTIDVYRGKVKPTKDVVSFLAFVSFFPQLVAGPISRAPDLLTQFFKNREFSYALASDGLKLILWGLFKKIVIANQCARYANLIFSDYADQTGSVLFLGAVYFAFQIYCDFSGYSDIAVGTAKLFGFDLKWNFHYPYFSRSIAEFWRKWHITLNTWFKDYVYFSLGGSRVSKSKVIRNIFIVFLLSGFWHGANWTFIMWGLINAIYFLPSVIFKRTSVSEIPDYKDLHKILFTFLLTLIAWIFFRSPTITDAFAYLDGMFSLSLFSIPKKNLLGLGSILFLLIIEWYSRKKKYPLENLGKYSLVRWCIYFILALAIGFNFEFHNPAEFIYFQF
jgi:alginate O-acetyltransferase complex protein AlgI